MVTSPFFSSQASWSSPFVCQRRMWRFACWTIVVGSGKTHSIMGVAEDPGILPRSLAEFFDCMSDSSLLREEMEDAAAEKEDEMGEEQLATKDHRTEGLEDGENRVGCRCFRQHCRFAKSVTPKVRCLEQLKNVGPYARHKCKVFCV